LWGLVINMSHASIAEFRVDVSVVELSVDLCDGADWAAAIREAISTWFCW
jgi:hypothetical protein